MENLDPKAIAAAIVDQVRRMGPDRGLRGSAAGACVRSVDAHFAPMSYGVTSLREFIARHAPELRIIGASGLDPIYGLKEWGDLPAAQAPPSPASAELWRVWVSPKSHLHLAVSQKGSLRVHSPTAPLAHDEVALEPATLADHREIAEAFLDSESSPVAVSLRAALDNPEWWREWSRILGSSAVQHRWQEFRTESLRSVLGRRLSELGFDEAVATMVVAAVSSTRRAPQDPIGPPARHPRESLPSASRTRDELVRLVSRVVSHMSEEDLRALKLPLGEVLDAVGFFGAARNGQ